MATPSVKSVRPFRWLGTRGRRLAWLLTVSAGLGVVGYAAAQGLRAEDLSIEARRSHFLEMQKTGRKPRKTREQLVAEWGPRSRTRVDALRERTRRMQRGFKRIDEGLLAPWAKLPKRGSATERAQTRRTQREQVDRMRAQSGLQIDTSALGGAQ